MEFEVEQFEKKSASGPEGSENKEDGVLSSFDGEGAVLSSELAKSESKPHVAK